MNTFMSSDTTYEIPFYLPYVSVFIPKTSSCEVFDNLKITHENKMLSLVKYDGSFCIVKGRHETGVG